MTAKSTRWEGVLGHDWAVQLLDESVRHNRIGHAYLFTGPQHIGKTTLARLFTQALNCTSPMPERPCGTCRACTLIAADKHADVRLIRPDISARGTASLKIDTIRQLQRDLSLSAYEARYKVAILRQFDAANVNAANAFLKTLEEPPGNVVLILTAVDADALLPTIRSRCRVIGLRPVPPELIEHSLQQRWSVAPDRARLLARLADGRIGWAVLAAQDEGLLQARAEWLAWLHELLGATRVERFALADRMARKPDALSGILQTWLGWWRDLNLLMQPAAGHPLAPAVAAIVSADDEAALLHLAQMWHGQQALDSLRQTLKAIDQIESNANIRLVLENLFLTYPLSGERQS